MHCLLVLDVAVPWWCDIIVVGMLWVLGLDVPAEGERRRKAAEVAISDSYHPGYKIPCELRADVFYPAIVTNHGGWYYQSSEFLKAVTHSGDKTDCMDLEAERFDHYSRTWSSWKHSTFLMQAVACNMAQAVFTAFETASKKALATESGSKSTQSYNNWDNNGVQPPSPRLGRP